MIWFTSENGNIEYASLTKKYIDKSLEVLQNFFLQETVSIACGISNDLNGKKELENLCLEVAKDGISVIAIDKNLDKVIGVAFNKLHVNNGKESFYEKFAKTCKSSSSRDLCMFMHDADSIVNLFEIGKTNCILDVMFLAIDPEYQRNKIGTKLVEISLEVGKKLFQGESITQSLNGELPLARKPGIVSGTFTSNISQRIRETLGFKIAAEINYKKLKRNGMTYYDILEGKQEKALIGYKVL